MEEAEIVTSLFQYPDEITVGLMTPDYPMVKEDITTANLLDQLRLLGEQAEYINFIFVVNDKGKLVGFLSMIRLDLSLPNAGVRHIMNSEIISVTAETD